MELVTFLKILRVRWLSILFFVLLGIGAGAAWAYTQPKVYTATASAIITAGVTSDIGSALAADNYAKSRVKSFIDIASSRSVARFAIEELGIEAEPQSLLGLVSVANPPETAVLRISAKGSTPTEARDLAEAWISGMIQAVAALESGTTRPATDSSTDTSTSSNLIGSEGEVAEDPTVSIVELKTLDSAIAPSSPSSPNTLLALEIGAVIGFIAGLVLALIRFNLDKRVRSENELEKEFHKPVIGVVPESTTIPTPTYTTDKFSASKSPRQSRGRAEMRSYNEAINKLRTNLQFMNVDEPPRIIVITSPLPGEGKSTVTCSLAKALAASGHNVVAIDADLRKPSLIKTFGLVEGAGLTDVLVGRVALEDVLQQSGSTGRLHVLGPGALPPNPSELLGSRAMSNLITEMSHDATVLIDSPPLLPVTDASILAARTDGAIIVLRAGRTTSVHLKQAIQNLDRASGHALGLVLNRVPLRGAGRAYYGYQYAGYYGDEVGELVDDISFDTKPGKRRKPRSSDS